MRNHLRLRAEFLCKLHQLRYGFVEVHNSGEISLRSVRVLQYAIPDHVHHGPKNDGEATRPLLCYPRCCDPDGYKYPEVASKQVVGVRDEICHRLSEPRNHRQISFLAPTKPA